MCVCVRARAGDKHFKLKFAASEQRHDTAIFNGYKYV